MVSYKILLSVVGNAAASNVYLNEVVFCAATGWGLEVFPEDVEHALTPPTSSHLLRVLGIVHTYGRSVGSNTVP